MELAKQTIYLVLTFSFVFLWYNSPLAAYTIPLFGILIILYIFIYTRARKSSFLDTGGTKTVLVLNTALLLFIFTTGGIHSPLFFLLYFVLFGVALAFEPVIVILYTLFVTALFFQQVIEGDLMNNLLTVASLYLIAPIAYFFSTEYKTRLKEEKQTQEKATVIQEDIAEVLENEELSTVAKEKLNEAQEKAQELTK